MIELFNYKITIPVWSVVLSILGIILVIIILKKKYSSDSLFAKKKKEILDEEVDFDNIINSSFNAKALYDKLRVRCHPDRFAADPTKIKIATEIQSLINENKNNLKSLNSLKKRAEEELGVKL